ncbi:MAG: metalloregulator ArsR/SmtB family transcription factor [Phycisphaerales bacterium]|jgi:DNA-binding transcriptional ArsR family regulator
MARAATTLDTFNAIAEPKRREMLTALAAGGGELAVNTIVQTLGWPQPQVSKHLAVLRQVGLVSVRRQGRERMYRVNGEQLRTVHDWAKTFEQFWSDQLDRIKQRAEAMASGGHIPPTFETKEKP